MYLHIFFTPVCGTNFIYRYFEKGFAVLKMGSLQPQWNYSIQWEKLAKINELAAERVHSS